ncbi:MAG: hypothetical protein U0353_34410 [Sandaracinus sp.]
MGHAYDIRLGEHASADATAACLRALVERGCTDRIRAIAGDGDGLVIVEATRADGLVHVRTLEGLEAAPIVAAAARCTGEISYDVALRLDEGLMDLEVPGYAGEPFSLPAPDPGARSFEVGSATRLVRELREAVDAARDASPSSECRAEDDAAITELEAMLAALELCTQLDLLLRTWE